jgi:HK97 gp10 family phage protein
VKVDLDYKECIYSIEQEIARIPEGMEKEKRSILNKSAKILKKEVEASFKNMESEVSPGTTNYDGSLPYVHMVDDIKTSVKDDKEGNMYAVIRGGKFTGYKWHMLENGTTTTIATHFIEKALKATENEINSYIDEAIGRVAQSGN